MGRFSTASYLFVTENPWIAERTQEFLKRRNLYADGEVSPAVSERYLAGLLWVMFGGKGKDLPQYLLLANCAAALEPRSDVVKQMHRFLSQVDSDQAAFFRTLMTEERAGQYMMQLTLGDSALLNQGNVAAVLDQVKNALIEKLEVDKQAEIHGIKTDHEAELRQHREKSDQLRQELLDTQASELQARAIVKETSERVERLEVAVNAQEAAIINDKKKLVEQCIHSTVTYGKVAHFLLAGIVATVGGLVTWFGLQESTSPIIKGASTFVVWLFAFIGFGKIPDHLLGNHMNRFRDWVFRNKLNAIGIAADEKLFSIDWENRSAVLKSREQQIKLDTTN